MRRTNKGHISAILVQNLHDKLALEIVIYLFQIVIPAWHAFCYRVVSKTL
jgi:hypothetical protein